MKIKCILLSLSFTLFLVLFSAMYSLGAEATFSWTPNDPPIVGYKIYYGTTSRCDLNDPSICDPDYLYPSVVDIRQPELVDGRVIVSVTGLIPGRTYFFAATAYTETAESDYTGEIPYTPPVTSSPDADSDMDGITDADELLIGTDHNLWDTDQDSINDGDEYDYWLAHGMDSETDSDNDGLANLIDADSDNDGFLDGVEVDLGFDPTDATSSPPLAMEFGEVAVGSQPIQVPLLNSYSQPVIIANSVTRNDSEPFVVRVSNVTTNRFDIQLQEYDYQDNIHGSETASYIVMEAGSYVLENGDRVEAGIFSTKAAKLKKIPLISDFKSKPIILTTLNSMNDPVTVTGRIKNVKKTHFKFKLQEQQANATSHGEESVAYMAWSQGSGLSDGFRYLAGKTKNKVTHKKFQVAISQIFNDLPYHFAALQTMDGGNTATLKITHSAIDYMDIMVEEEQSKNSETRHTTEVAGFLVIAPE